MIMGKTMDETYRDEYNAMRHPDHPGQMEDETP